MPSELITIVCYSAVMALSSFFSGLIPLSIRLSSSKLSYISKFSVGLLISTSMVLIIPEGLSHYTVDQPVGLWMLLGFVVLFSVDSISSILNSSHTHGLKSSETYQLQELGPSEEGLNTTTPPLTSTDSEQFFEVSNSPASNYRLSGLETPRGRREIIRSVFMNPTTLGLIIHSLTDGIALASSIVASSDQELSLKSTFIVFAIFIHKLPTSFALSSVLLAEGKRSTNSQGTLTKREILYHIGIFSLSAPFGAILTYLILSWLFNINLNEFSGELLVASGGSFLYVGFHSLHGIYNEADHEDSSKVKQFTGFFVCLLGMIVPTFITLIGDVE
ncbi:hypothetical protein CANARDRAFT_160831 [[Candida] arabinofermentans NRRL YB-2248]|uniref:Zinc/iron permease n=1 Tax=[Candida] arabinofermentans NRRL YB-2248 TaxID=983967 RepID=A0A1E4T0D0_9ASCO|nr:hypothetical protein CANARDRAFT_160831 [[Candida] arabinofermentans NRRL YB-2248]